MLFQITGHMQVIDGLRNLNWFRFLFRRLHGHWFIWQNANAEFATAQSPGEYVVVFSTIMTFAA